METTVRSPTLLLGFLLATRMAAAQAQSSDAQVEANVLKALASAPELAGESITTHTVYGVVTLSGTVQDEARRTKAETLAANASGVTKVVDELELRQAGVSTDDGRAEAQPGDARPLVLQSDGTYAPAQGDDHYPADVNCQGADASTVHPVPGSAPAAGAQRNDPDNDQALDQQASQGSYGRRPLGADGVPGPGQNGPSSARPAGARSSGPASGTYTQQGQPAGQQALIPGGTLLQVRVDHTLASDRTPAGTAFTGVVISDVAADGYVAIPRGASVAGTVMDAQRSGALKGRGEMSVTLNSVTLGGHVYPLTTDLWAHHGGDKTIETVNKTAGFGAVGAVIGALAAGGVGAAVGGGLGAAVGLGSSASSGNGQVVIPAETVVAFRLAQPVTVSTVSQQEMQRLASNAYPRAAPGYNPGYDLRPRRVSVGPIYPYPVWGLPGYGYPGYYPPPPPFGYPVY